MPNPASGKPKREYGEPTEGLRGGSQATFSLQHHETARRPNRPHLDLRIGTPETGMYSWALPSGVLPEPGKKQLAPQSRIHSMGYGKFQGNIPEGRYGTGKVRLQQYGGTEITKVTPTTVHFTLTGQPNAPRFVLIKTDVIKPSGQRDWILLAKPADGPTRAQRVPAGDMEGAMAQAKTAAAEMSAKPTQAAKKEQASDLAVVGKSDVHGKGVLTTDELRDGTLIGRAFKQVGFTGDPDSDWSRTELGEYINHADTPNAVLKKTTEGGDTAYDVVLLKTLVKDEEITLDYNKIPWAGKRDFTQTAKKELDKAAEPNEKRATLGTVINRKSFPTARKLLAYQLRKLRQGGAAGRNLAGSLSKNPEAAAVGGIGALIPVPAPTGTASLVAYLALKKKLLTIMSKTGAAKAEKEPWRVEKSDIHGKGLFAIRDIPTGGHVTHTADLEDDEGLGRWELSEAARYTNHSPDPNTRATSDGQKMTMVAASPIKKGDEITVSYFQVASTTGAGARITHKGKPMCSVGAGELRKWVGSAPEEKQATIMSKTGAATLAKVAQGAWRPTAAQLYRAVASAETGGEPDPWIRTKYREAPGGSTAYGPVQLTRTTAEGYQTKYPQFFTAPQLEYLKKYKQQGKQFAYHGNMEGKVPDFNAQYDYGGTGSLTNAADKTMYGEVAQRMLAHHQQTTPNTLKAVERWRGVPPGKDKRYYREVQRSLDAQRAAPVAVKPAPPVAPMNAPPAAPMNAPPFKGGSAEFEEKQATIKQEEPPPSFGAIAAKGLLGGYLVNKGLPATVGLKRTYHGTRSDVMPKIKLRGLDPAYGGSLSGGGAALGPVGERYRLRSKGRVHVGLKPIARAHAAIASAPAAVSPFQKQRAYLFALLKGLVGVPSAGKITSVSMPASEFASRFSVDPDLRPVGWRSKKKVGPEELGRRGFLRQLKLRTLLREARLNPRRFARGGAAMTIGGALLASAGKSGKTRMDEVPEEKQATIKQKGGKWLLYSHKGKVLGTHDSEEKARKQEQAIQISKHAEHKVAFTLWPRWGERADRKGLKDIFSAGEGVDTDARKTLIDSVMQHRRNPTVPTGSTVLTRSHIEGDKLSPKKLKGMGFLPSYVAVPERGQKSFRTWRHPETEIHLHQHPKNWLFHEDKWPSLAMARIKAKRIAAAGPPQSGAQKMRARWNLLRDSASHVTYEGIPGYLNYASGSVMNKPRFAIPGEPVHAGSSALGQVSRVAGLSALLGGITSGGDTHRFARNAARVAGTFAGIEGGQRLHKVLSERYAAVRHPGLLSLMIQLGMPIAGAVGADAIAKRLVPKKEEEEETDKVGSIQANKHAEHVDPDWWCPKCGKKLGATAKFAATDGEHHYHAWCLPKDKQKAQDRLDKKAGDVIPQKVLQAIYSRNRAALSEFGRRGAARKAAIRAAEKSQVAGTPQEPLKDLLARVKKQIPLEAKRDPHIIHTTIKDGQVRVDAGRFLEKRAGLSDDLLVSIGMGTGAEAVYKGLSRIDDTVNFNDKTFLRNLRRQMGASPDLDISLGSSSYYDPTKRQIKIEPRTTSGPVTVRKGVVAHELGHATGKRFPGGFHRGGLVKYLPVIGLVGTSSRDENTARLSALGGTAISIPTVGEEIRASRRGAKALKALQGGKKMRFGGRMGPYAGLITYLAAAGIPLAAYGVNKRKGYYRPAKKSAQAIKEGAVSLQIVAEGRSADITMEIADTQEKRAMGLSGRSELPPGHGMFFDKAGAYWMKDVAFPLDLLYLDKTGQVIEIHHMPDDDPHTIYRPGNKEAEHAIELAAGWFDKQGFKVGDKVVVHTGVEALDNT